MAATVSQIPILTPGSAVYKMVNEVVQEDFAVTASTYALFGPIAFFKHHVLLHATFILIAPSAFFCCYHYPSFLRWIAHTWK